MAYTDDETTQLTTPQVTPPATQRVACEHPDADCEYPAVGRCQACGRPLCRWDLHAHQTFGCPPERR